MQGSDVTGEVEGLLLLKFSFANTGSHNREQKACFAAGGPDETRREECTRPGVKGCPSVGQRGGETLRTGPEPPGKSFTTWGLGFQAGPKEK